MSSPIFFVFLSGLQPKQCGVVVKGKWLRLADKFRGANGLRHPRFPTSGATNISLKKCESTFEQTLVPEMGNVSFIRLSSVYEVH